MAIGRCYDAITRMMHMYVVNETVQCGMKDPLQVSYGWS